MKNNIVFDFGAVVFRWQPVLMLLRELPHIATNTASAEHWVAQIFQNYGGDWGEFDRGMVEPAELVQRIAARTGLAASDVQRVVDAVPDELQPRPDTADWVQRLHAAGQPLYFLSNMPMPYADHLERRHGSVLRCFTDGVFSGRVKHIKPDPAIYALAAERFGQPPASLVFLDDHLPNVLAARSAGWQAVQFQHAAQAEADLQRHGWLT